MAFSLEQGTRIRQRYIEYCIGRSTLRILNYLIEMVKNVRIINNVKKHFNMMKGKIYKFLTLKLIYPYWYRWCARQKVEEDKVVFVEAHYTELLDSFQIIYYRLQREYNFRLECCFLRVGFTGRWENLHRHLQMIQKVATAKYVFLYDSSTAVSACPFRKETTVVQLWHGCGAFKKFSFSTADLIFGASREEQIKYPNNKNYSFVTVSSPEVIWAYAEAMMLEDNTGIIRPIGVSRTDIFFDTTFLAQARKNLFDLIPEAEGKKILVYAPTFRGRIAKGEPPNALSIEMLGEVFSDDYVLLIKHHPLVRKIPSVPEKWRHFAFDVTKSMTIENLLCIADICVSDYSSLIFEYSLFERPMIFFAYDLEEYFDWRGFYYPYDNTFLPGPIVRTNKELIDYIQNPEKLDSYQVKKFKEKFMASCDGHATDRILQEAFGKELEKHKKTKASEDEISPPKVEFCGKNFLREVGKSLFYSRLNRIYCKCNKVESNEVVFILQNNEIFSATAEAIKYELEETGNFYINEIRLNQKNKWEYIKNCEKAIKMLANAHYIITDEDIILFKHLHKSVNNKLIWCDSPYDFLLRNRELIAHDEERNSILVGKDVYLGKAIADKKEALFTQYENLNREKKILLFAARTDIINKIDWQQLTEYLSDEYQFLVFSKNHKIELSIPQHLQNNIVQLDSHWLLEDGILLADVLVGESDLRVLQGLSKGKKVLFWGVQPDRLLLKIDDDLVREYYKKAVCNTTMDVIHKISGDIKIEEDNIKDIVQKYFSQF